MRLLSSISSILFIICSLATTISATAQSGNLDGVWKPVHQEISGRVVPESTFQKQRLTIKGDQYTTIAESIDKGTITQSGNHLDIYGKEGVNAGRHFKATYKIENGVLTICYDLSGDHYPPNFVTMDQDFYFLSVFKK